MGISDDARQPEDREHDPREQPGEERHQQGESPLVLIFPEEAQHELPAHPGHRERRADIRLLRVLQIVNVLPEQLIQALQTLELLTHVFLEAFFPSDIFSVHEFLHVEANGAKYLLP